MRTFLLGATIIISTVILLLVAGGVALAYYGPIHPGNIIFPIQDYAEQEFGLIYHQPVQNAGYLLSLVDRRINDLNYRTGSKYEFIAMEYLDQSINRVTTAIAEIPQAQSDGLRMRLEAGISRIEAALGELKHIPIEDQAALVAFQAKLQTIKHMATLHNPASKELALVPMKALEAETNSVVTFKPINSATGLIPFPPGSPGAIHAFYPLEGQHVSLQCTRCHTSGAYFGTLNKCIYCHITELPASHYPADCALCHTAVSWSEIHFEHASVASTACSECHEIDKPANHYNGPCSACHVTDNWTSVHFDHIVAGAVDCIACHAKVAPADHYPGQCSNCHNTSNWADAHFNHTGFTNCSGCHAGNAPGNHYSGQCSNCHNTTNWANVHFNHSGYTDCIGCHAGNAPGDHYSGQCSDCHGTSSWGNAHFSHGGLTDCISCHLKDRPREHDQGQCSECHNTSNWSAEDH